MVSAPPFDDWDDAQLSLDSDELERKLFNAECDVPTATGLSSGGGVAPPPLPRPPWEIGGWPMQPNHRRERRFSALLRGLPTRKRTLVSKHLRLSPAERRALAAEVILDRNVREQQVARRTRATVRGRLKSRCAAGSKRKRP